MFQSSLKNKIATSNLLGVALLIAVVFGLIYITVSTNVNLKINRDLDWELENHRSEVKLRAGKIQLFDPEEWNESEHENISIYPVFISFFNADKTPLADSPNLGIGKLHLQNGATANKKLDLYLNDIPIRQAQTPLYFNEQIVGHVVIAIAIDTQVSVLKNLSITLGVTYPIVLLMLFLLTRYIAGKNINPTLKIIETTKGITDTSLNTRIVLPPNKDELHTLANSINQLLDTIEHAMTREKQFTSNASHELRTPIAIIKGTLEVLNRKERTVEEYKEKIAYCIQECDRINTILEQLLLLARSDHMHINEHLETFSVEEVLLETLEIYNNKIVEKNLNVQFDVIKKHQIVSNKLAVEIILQNIISNAIKYNQANGILKINIEEHNNQLLCTISDQGIGMTAEELQKIYEKFYRSEAVAHSEIYGNGLGLSIVKSLTDLLHIKLSYTSAPQCGTQVRLEFPNN
ncbi:MAG: HAMP domain-containing histidine kinase [Flavobacterium sp.]|nr:HAMP domain-containing histidine kinase [Candidatus Neoflavobacterium equi]